MQNLTLKFFVMSGIVFSLTFSATAIASEKTKKDDCTKRIALLKTIMKDEFETNQENIEMIRKEIGLIDRLYQANLNGGKIDPAKVGPAIENMKTVPAILDNSLVGRNKSISELISVIQKTCTDKN